MTAWALLDKSQSPALLGLEPIVNFGPEGTEVSDGGPESKEYNEVQSDLPGPMKVGVLLIKQKQSNGHDLCHHLDLSQFRRRNGESLIGGDEPQTIDCDFTPNDDADHPCGNQIELHQSDKYQGNQQLVRYWVQQNPQGRDLSTLASNVAIQKISG